MKNINRKNLLKADSIARKLNTQLKEDILKKINFEIFELHCGRQDFGLRSYWKINNFIEHDNDNLKTYVYFNIKIYFLKQR